MSLFPAYGVPGGSKRTQSQSTRRGRNGGGQGPSSSSSGRSDGVMGETASNPITINDDDEEGELRSSDETPPSTSGGGGAKKSKNKKRKDKKRSNKRKRSRSRSRSPKNKDKRAKREKSQEPSTTHNSRDNRDYNRRNDRNEGGYQRYGQYQGQGQQRYNEERRFGGRGENNGPRYEQDGYYERDQPGRFDGSRNRGGQWNQRGGGQGDEDYGYQNEGRNRKGDQFYEEQRLTVAQRFPRKVFLEEVNLKPEFAFRVDPSPGNYNLKTFGMGVAQKSFYPNEGLKVVGASDQELTQIYSKFSKFRCILPTDVDKNSDDNDSESEGGRPSSELKVETFISCPNKKKSAEDPPVDKKNSSESLGFSKKKEPSMKEKVEEYNKRVREEPKNIQLWKEFIDFQDKYFEENEKVYSENEEVVDQSKKQKKRRNKKALLEKKVAIIEKALESNAKSLDLHMMRLNYLCTLKQPDAVLSEWKKLVAGNQQVNAFWVEHLRFASTQLQIYSSTRISSILRKSFQKFRLMLSPSFPEFQRPSKFLLFINEVLLFLSLMRRNAGYREKSLAYHQAQIEVDFNAPTEKLKSASLLEWNENKKMFEFFWDIGTAKFGENSAPGWSKCMQDVEKYSTKTVIGISDAKLSELEDSYFETASKQINGNKDEDESRHWLLIESSRSKFQWMPWRAKCSDLPDVEDSSRIILGEDISPYIVMIPELDYITQDDKDAAYFRHIVNFLTNLQEDFIPQTHTTSSVLSPFASISLTESRSLVSELVYWRKLLNLYVPENSSANSNTDQTLKPLFKTPEGFWVKDWTTPNNSAFKCDVGRKDNAFDLKYTDKDAVERNYLLLENQLNLMSMIREVIDKGIDILPPWYAAVLCEMYLRFEQKNWVGSRESCEIKTIQAKRFLAKEPIRNSLGAYFEMATLEYFEGNVKTGIDIIIKSLNVACANLIKPDKVTGLVIIENNWENVTEATKLYVRLAEFHFIDKPELAFQFLASLGSGFKEVNLELDLNWTGTSKTNLTMKALRYFEKVMAQLVPGFDEQVGDSEVIFMLSAELLGRWDGKNFVEYLGQKSNLVVEWTKAFALFQFLAKDFSASCQVYEKVLERIEVLQPLSLSGNYDSNILIGHYIREQLYINWCNLGAHVLTKNPMTNSKFRNILGQALKEFPSSPPLLLLFTDVENQMSIAGKLWRMMTGIVKQDGGCNHWAPLFMGIGLAKKIEDLEHDEEIGLTSFGLGGPSVFPDSVFYKLDSLLTSAQENRMTRNCPLLWRVHLKLLALRTLQGKDIQRAKATFYEAVRHCPSAKALYMDGIAYFPEMFKEINDLMVEKQINTRLFVPELKLLLEPEAEEKSQDTITIDSSSSDDDH